MTTRAVRSPRGWIGIFDGPSGYFIRCAPLGATPKEAHTIARRARKKSLARLPVAGDGMNEINTQ